MKELFVLVKFYNTKPTSKLILVELGYLVYSAGVALG